MTDLADKLRILAGQPLPSTSYASFSARYQERSILVAFDTDPDWNITSLTLNVGYDAASNANTARMGAPMQGGGYRDPAAAAQLIATRPLKIHLRHENAADTFAKEHGVASEWSSGDPPFDSAIYVSGPKHESNLLAQVLNPSVRSGVMDLLLHLGFSWIEIDDNNGHVAAKTAIGVRSGGTQDADDRIARIFDAFERILTSLPKVTASGKKHAGRPLPVLSWMLMVIGAGGWLGSIPFTVAFTKVVRQVRDGHVSNPLYDTPWLALIVGFIVGIAGGLLGSKVYGSIMEARVRGDAEAHNLISGAKIRAFGGFSVITFFIVYGLMFWFTSFPAAH